LRIVHVIESTATGVLTMAAALASEQARTRWVGLIYSRRPESPVDVESRFPGIARFVQLNMSRPSSYLSALFRLRSALQTIQPDVVFLHSSVAGFLGRLALIGTLPQSRIYYIPHCISFMRRDIGPFRRSLFSALERVAGLRRAVYIACSQSELAAIRSTLPGMPSVLIENAVAALSPRRSAAKSEQAAPKPLTVVTVGQARAQKNPEDFARIARRIIEKVPGSRFIWIGDGDQRFAAVLRDAGVEVTGWRSRSEVLAGLETASVYLSTARWEGMPVSVLEAMSVGVPLVLSECDGNRDVVRDGETGYLFRSIDEAVQRIEMLSADPGLGTRLTQAARQDFDRRFSFDRYWAAMNELLRSAH
jgi:glycosyltransferase involved in cell wall biosynthesis